MAIQRTRKEKEKPHYGFLISWQPEANKKTSVNRESKIASIAPSASIRHRKNADSLAQEARSLDTKKSIVRSLIIISLILILELVVYLAWIKLIK